MSFLAESSMMSWLRRGGFESLAWAMRRFHLPVDAKALVLEVGSGGNPYPRANVLLDAYEATRERHWAPLAADRPAVLGFVENLPFKNQVFDFVVAAHVLEHSSEPERFLSELQRVASAGYIEVPDALLERLNPYRDHRLEITCRGQTLVIRKKTSWRHDPEVVALYEDRVKPVFTKELVPRHPFQFHVRYYWRNAISYQVVNPEVDAAWSAPAVEENGRTANNWKAAGKITLRDNLRGFLSQSQRNANIDLIPLLRCTACQSGEVTRVSEGVRCLSCNAVFPVRTNGVFAMNDGRLTT